MHPLIKKFILFRLRSICVPISGTLDNPFSLYLYGGKVRVPITDLVLCRSFRRLDVRAYAIFNSTLNRKIPKTLSFALHAYSRIGSSSTIQLFMNASCIGAVILFCTLLAARSTGRLHSIYIFKIFPVT